MEGYLQLHSEELNQKVYTILDGTNFKYYSEDPLKFPSKPLATIDLKIAKLNELESTKKGKSFALSLPNSTIIEFSCATNSIKGQWMKSILLKNNISNEANEKSSIVLLPKKAQYEKISEGNYCELHYII
jgi:hypothetical protein